MVCLPGLRISYSSLFLPLLSGPFSGFLASSIQEVAGSHRLDRRCCQNLSDCRTPGHLHGGLCHTVGSCQSLRPARKFSASLSSSGFYGFCTPSVSRGYSMNQSEHNGFFILALLSFWVWWCPGLLPLTLGRPKLPLPRNNSANRPTLRSAILHQNRRLRLTIRPNPQL